MLRLQQPTDVRIEKSTPRIMGIGSSVAVLVVNAVHLRPDEDRGRSLDRRQIPRHAPPDFQARVSHDSVLRKMATSGRRIDMLSIAR